MFSSFPGLHNPLQYHPWQPDYSSLRLSPLWYTLTTATLAVIASSHDRTLTEKDVGTEGFPPGTSCLLFGCKSVPHRHSRILPTYFGRNKAIYLSSNQSQEEKWGHCDGKIHCDSLPQFALPGCVLTRCPNKINAC